MKPMDCGLRQNDKYLWTHFKRNQPRYNCGMPLENPTSPFINSLLRATKAVLSTRGQADGKQLSSSVGLNLDLALFIPPFGKQKFSLL